MGEEAQYGTLGGVDDDDDGDCDSLIDDDDESLGGGYDRALFWESM